MTSPDTYAIIRQASRAPELRGLSSSTVPLVFFCALIVALSVWQGFSTDPQRVALLCYLTLLSIVGGTLLVLSSLRLPRGEAQARDWRQAEQFAQALLRRHGWSRADLETAQALLGAQRPPFNLNVPLWACPLAGLLGTLESPLLGGTMATVTGIFTLVGVSQIGWHERQQQQHRLLRTMLLFVPEEPHEAS